VGRRRASVRGRPQAEGLLRVDPPERAGGRRCGIRRSVRAGLQERGAARPLSLRRARGAVLVDTRADRRR
jgi:hypothetical protein